MWKHLKEKHQRAKSVSFCLLRDQISPNQQTPTSLWEKLSVDVFKGVFIDDSTGTFLEDQIKVPSEDKTTFGNTEEIGWSREFPGAAAL